MQQTRTHSAVKSPACRYRRSRLYIFAVTSLAAFVVGLLGISPLGYAQSSQRESADGAEQSTAGVSAGPGVADGSSTRPDSPPLLPRSRHRLSLVVIVSLGFGWACFMSADFIRPSRLETCRDVESATAAPVIASVLQIERPRKSRRWRVAELATAIVVLCSEVVVTGVVLVVLWNLAFQDGYRSRFVKDPFAASAESVDGLASSLRISVSPRR